MLKSKDRIKLLWILGPLAQVALVLSIILERLGNPANDFLLGFLVGFALAGSLAFLYVTVREVTRGNLG